ncbi:MAG: VWA domain-containing protein [Candidatus Koribacter versatilis]|uniref:VWA domain-containing protein n=1 Tax=Candidatus Korobacter versatilis TaxID=658062 RepID=A0A932A9V6_9BACT|nr:VWA domain-containing protein [Candidatus Koribacter versatilis]
MRHFLSAFLLVGVTAAPITRGQDLPSAPSSTSKAPAQQPAPQAAAPAPSASAPLPAAVSQPPKPATTATAAAPATDEDVPSTGTIIKKRVDEVNVIFTVTDKGGKFIKGLKQADFSVLDDHKPPQSMVAFRSETNLPLRVGLLVDASNSIRDRFVFEQQAATEFLNQTVRPKVDRAFVVGFDSTPEVTADFTDSTEKLGKGVAMLRPGGGTALWDAIYYACRDKLLKHQDDFAVRRAIVVLSDGDDNQSRVTRQEATEMAQRAEVIVYAISTNISGVVTRGDKYLQELAEATGGRVFFPMKLDDIAEKFAQIQEELRSQYALAYKPTDFQADGRYRAIDILASNKKYKVRARKGYYAPRQ